MRVVSSDQSYANIHLCICKLMFHPTNRYQRKSSGLIALLFMSSTAVAKFLSFDK